MGQQETPRRTVAERCTELLREQVDDTVLSLPADTVTPFFYAALFVSVSLSVREGLVALPQNVAAVGHTISILAVIALFNVGVFGSDDKLPTDDSDKLNPVITEAARALEESEEQLDTIILKRGAGSAATDLARDTCLIKVNPSEMPTTPMGARAVLAHEVGHYLNHRWLRVVRAFFPLPLLLGSPLLSLPTAAGAVAVGTIVAWLITAKCYRMCEYEADAYAAEQAGITRNLLAEQLARTLNPSPILFRPILGAPFRWLCRHPSSKQRIERLLNNR